MFLGLSRADLGLTLFIVALVYAAVWVPRLTERIAIMMAKRSSPPKEKRGS